MAQYTNSSGSIMRPYRSPLGSYQIRHYQESTAVSTALIKAGHLVSNNTVVSTGGFPIRRTLADGGSGANLFDSTNSQTLVGVALADSTSDGSTTLLGADGATPGVRAIPVAIADGHTEFLGFFKTAVTAGGDITASSLIGQLRAIIFDSTLNVFFLDSTNSTAANRACAITDIPWDIGSCGGGPVLFKFLSTNVSPAVRLGGPVQ